MKFVDNIEKFQKNRPLCVALGTFDGVHKGHKAVISEAVNSDMQSMVFIINRPVNSFKTSPMITTSQMQTEEIEKLGVDYLIKVDFEDICNLSPEEFISEILFKTLGAKKIVCGFNYRFGKGASGDTKLLEKLCEKYEMALTVVPAVFNENFAISSSRIRDCIECGRMKDAEDMLGRPFGFNFMVVDGDHLGRKLGFPTINQPFPEKFIIPKYGVYAATVTLQGERYSAVCNVGERPTVRKSLVRAETYIMDFSGNLYGQNVHINLIKFLRPEKKFPSLDQLKKAIANDAKTAKAFIENLGE